MTSITKQEQYLIDQMHKIFEVQPNTTGSLWLNNWYKRTTKHLKSMPFILLLPMAFVVSFFVYTILGKLTIIAVSFLQHGF
ncbi:hypothetical protein KC726_01690 [Candidatus Woesebacteria bacterium]|nr:hypothetical protein [Candidatus Woesebacteria bacterium]